MAEKDWDPTVLTCLSTFIAQGIFGQGRTAFFPTEDERHSLKVHVSTASHQWLSKGDQQTTGVPCYNFGESARSNCLHSSKKTPPFFLVALTFPLRGKLLVVHMTAVQQNGVAVTEFLTTGHTEGKMKSWFKLRYPR